MRSIQLPDDQYQYLAKRALAEGYADVDAFISAMVGEPFEDPRGKLSEDELRKSVAELEAADASIDAGGGHDAKEAFLKLGREFGFEMPE